LANVVEEGPRLTTAGKDLDLPELNPDPFGLYTLLAGTNFDRLFGELQLDMGMDDSGGEPDSFDGGLLPISTGWDTGITF
jgi:hypothetical protein